MRTLLCRTWQTWTCSIFFFFRLGDSKGVGIIAFFPLSYSGGIYKNNVQRCLL